MCHKELFKDNNFYLEISDKLPSGLTEITIGEGWGFGGGGGGGGGGRMGGGGIVRERFSKPNQETDGGLILYPFICDM